MNRRPQRRTSRNLRHARSLRSELTGPEQKLWGVLRDRRLCGLKFVRQAPIEQFIVDFACRERRVIVEVDGDSHADRGELDRVRQETLERAGWRVVRVSNDDVLADLEGVLCVIVAAVGLDPAAWLNGAHGQLPEISR